MSRTLQSLPELKRALAACAEQICAHYLSAGEKSGHYWRVGDITNTRGRSMFIALTGPSAGQWSDPDQGTHGDLLDIILYHERGDFGRACRAARALIGDTPIPTAPATTGPNPHFEAAKRNFAEARRLRATHGARYLAGRAIRPPDAHAVLRFHPALVYRSSLGSLGVYERYPGLVAAVTDKDGAFLGIQRTYLDHTRPEKADIDDQRRTLASTVGGAIRFDDDGDTLAVGEGLETMLSLRMAFPKLPVAACAGTQLLALWEPSPRHKRILIAVDGDEPGELAAATLAERLRAQSLHVVYAHPAEADFNEDLQQIGARALRSHLAPAIRKLCA